MILKFVVCTVFIGGKYDYKTVFGKKKILGPYKKKCSFFLAIDLHFLVKNQFLSISKETILFVKKVILHNFRVYFKEKKFFRKNLYRFSKSKIFSEKKIEKMSSASWTVVILEYFLASDYNQMFRSLIEHKYTKIPVLKI